MDLVTRETPALQADQVEPGQARAVAHHQSIGDDVALDAGHAANHRVLPDADILVHGGQAAEDGVVPDMDMPAQRGVVDQRHLRAELAVMRHVTADHQETAFADLGQEAAAGGAGMQGRVLADDGALADDEAGRFALVLAVLRRQPDSGEGKDPRALADLGVAGDDYVTHQLDIVGQRHVGPDRAVGTDRHPLAEPGLGIDDRHRMDLAHQSSRIIAA